MDSLDFTECIFRKVFERDINRLLSMGDMWKQRKPPTPLDHTKISQDAKDLSPEVAYEDQRKWSLAENYMVFADSVKRLASRMLELKAKTAEGGPAPIMSFDKDDEDTLDFVAAGANLRSYIFGIEMKSKFDIKRERTQNALTNPQRLTCSRDGRKYHPRDRHNKRHHRRPVRPSGLQGPAQRS